MPKPPTYDEVSAHLRILFDSFASGHLKGEQGRLEAREWIDSVVTMGLARVKALNKNGNEVGIAKDLIRYLKKAKAEGKMEFYTAILENEDLDHMRLMYHKLTVTFWDPELKSSVDQIMRMKHDLQQSLQKQE